MWSYLSVISFNYHHCVQENFLLKAPVSNFVCASSSSNSSSSPSSPSSSSLTSSTEDSPLAPPFSPCDELSPVSSSSSQLGEDTPTLSSEVETPTPDETSETPTPITEDVVVGFKIVGDNIDKNVKPSRQRAEIKAQSLHYFHSYAVKDRVPVNGLSDNSPNNPTPNSADLLPSEEDLTCIRDEMRILLSR